MAQAATNLLCKHVETRVFGFSFRPYEDDWEFTMAKPGQRSLFEEDKLGLDKKAPPPSTSICGLHATIVATRNDGSRSVQQATVGGILNLDGASYALTAAHAFFDITGFEGTDGEYASSRPDDSSGGGRSPPELKVYGGITSVHVQKSGGTEPVPLCQNPIYRLSKEPFNSQTAACLGLDWALLRISDDLCYELHNHTADQQRCQVTGVCRIKRPEATKVLMACGESGSHQGNLTGLSTLIDIPWTHRPIKTWIVKGSSGHLNKRGDCGSRVIDVVTSKLYGMIIAHSRRYNHTYIVPAEPVLQDIAAKCSPRTRNLDRMLAISPRVHPLPPSWLQRDHQLLGPNMPSSIPTTSINSFTQAPVPAEYSPNITLVPFKQSDEMLYRQETLRRSKKLDVRSMTANPILLSKRPAGQEEEAAEKRIKLLTEQYEESARLMSDALGC